MPPPLLLGVGLGTLSWYGGFSAVVALGRKRIGERLLRLVDLAGGSGLIGFGGLLGSRTLHRHEQRPAIASPSVAREHAFTDVDAQPDPAAWVRVLDRVRSEPAYAAYKRRTLELLDPRRGGTYLEVGMGTGADALACAERFGVAVVGVDSSRVMVQEARRRGLRDAVVADAHALPFDPDAFDGAWADRTFQHLADPVAALAELARVVRPGGRIVVADPDYGTQAVDVPDQELARRVLRFRAERALRNGTLAHTMGRLFAQAGLAEVQAEEVPIVLRDPAALDNAMGLRDWAGFAHEQGLVESDEVGAWEAALDEAAASGSFRYSFSIFITAGRRRLPDGP